MKNKNMITIVLPEGEGIKTGEGTQVLCGGQPIYGVERVVIDVSADSIIQAQITVAVDQVYNLRAHGISCVIDRDPQCKQDLTGVVHHRQNCTCSELPLIEGVHDIAE